MVGSLKRANLVLKITIRNLLTLSDPSDGQQNGVLRLVACALKQTFDEIGKRSVEHSFQVLIIPNGDILTGMITHWFDYNLIR